MSLPPLTIVDRIVIAGGRQPESRSQPQSHSRSLQRSRVFAGIHLLPNGELLVGYREGSDHLKTDDGVIMMTRSADNGQTWCDPIAVVQQPGWDCAGGNRMLQLNDGQLLMFVFKARWNNSADTASERESHVLPTRSSDGGRSWSAFEPEMRLFDGWTEPYAHGHLLQAKDGSWLLPVHGADSVGGTTYSTLASSSDEGRSWSRCGVIAAAADINYYETDLIRLEDGRLLAAIRTDDPPFATYQAYSDDDGGSWSEPQPTGFCGPTPRLFRVRSGALICAYRDRDPTRPGVSYSISEEGGQSWQFAGQLYEGTDWNCGYPDMVRLPSNEIFCVFYTSYDKGDAQIHGLRLRDET